MRWRTLIKQVWAVKTFWVVPLAFLLPLKLVMNSDPTLEKQLRCAYVIIVMAILWFTEAIPIPATALLPIFLFPMLEVASAKTISGMYVTDTTMLFLGGLIIALALEESGLHIRISSCVMMLVGSQPIFLMAGLMATTFFLSMWISNTAATSMMLPIIKAVIETTQNVQESVDHIQGEENIAYEMEDAHKVDMKDKLHDTQDKDSHISQSTGIEHAVTVEESSNNTTIKHPEIARQAKAYTLTIAYGANIGGIATLTGTPPNLVMKNFADDLYKKVNLDSGITFAKWMGFAFPLSLLTAILGWLWLALFFLRCSCFKKMDPAHKLAISQSVHSHFKQLGRITFCEMQILFCFVVLVVLWLCRDPPNMKGWGSGFKSGYISDSTPCIVLGVLLFVLPSKKPNVFCWQQEGTEPSYTPILTWQIVTQKMSWGVVILLGGGFAIAHASEASGLSQLLGHKLKNFGHLDVWVMNLIITIIVAAATEVTSNTATATLLMPIMYDLAIATEVNPLYLMMSSAIACSFAFMLPVATPPNAIVFSTKYLTVPDMVLAGIPMNIIAIACLTLAINTWGTSMYDLSVVPTAFKSSTVAPNTTASVL